MWMNFWPLQFILPFSVQWIATTVSEFRIGRSHFFYTLVVAVLEKNTVVTIICATNRCNGNALCNMLLVKNCLRYEKTVPCWCLFKGTEHEIVLIVSGRKFAEICTSWCPSPYSPNTLNYLLSIHVIRLIPFHILSYYDQLFPMHWVERQVLVSETVLDLNYSPKAPKFCSIFPLYVKVQCCGSGFLSGSISIPNKWKS